MKPRIPDGVNELDDSPIGSARIDTETARGPRGDVQAGGDPDKAPHSLMEAQGRPPRVASSGTAWDDPDEL